LTMPGVEFHSFLAVSGTAREVGLAISSASKAFNLAGLKCAFVINGNPERFEVRRSSLSGAVGHFGALAGAAARTKALDWLAGAPAGLQVRRSSLSGAVGHFGALAGEAALTTSLDWLDALRGALAANLDLMDSLLAEHLPRARWRRPDAGFVAWIDLRAYPGL